MRKLIKIIIFSLSGLLPVSLAGATDLNLIIIYDNNPYNEELETRWGLSCLVEGLEKTILFDVGAEGLILIQNMEKLKIVPESIGAVILSHIHYDYIGGLLDFLKRNPHVIVYVPSSFPQGIKKEIKDAGATLAEVGGPLEICKNAYSTGELGGWLKEQSLIMKTSKGLVIITGCAHPGIVEIIKKAKEMLKADAYLVLGGFHLCWMNARQVKSIISGVQREKVEKVAPCHCSGDLARKQFKKSYGKNFILSGAGKRIKIADAF